MAFTSFATTAAAQGWQGLAHLSYQVKAGKTVPLKTYTQAPLRLQRPFYPEPGGLCHSTLVHTAGGMVAGDSLDLDIQLQPHSQALITTAAASKVYGQRSTTPAPSPATPQAVTQTVQIALEAHTCLEWFPQETIVFNGAHYRQQLRVELAAEARWLGWDITRFGRSARGERFQQGHWRSSLEVWQQGRPLWIDRQYLEGGSSVLESANGLAGYPVVATLALVGQLPAPEQIRALRQLWPGDLPGDIGISRLQCGLVCRYRGPSTQAARHWFMAIWQELRPWYLGQPACRSRVWAV